MDFIRDGIDKAVDLLVHGDSDLFGILGVTLKIALLSTLFAVVIGVPVALAVALGRFRGRGVAFAFLNAGLGLPPVVLGLIVALFLFRNAPLGGLEWIYTVNGVILAQTLLSLPIVAAFSASALQSVPSALLDQARALGASRAQVGMLAIREARVGILAAVIGAMGSALSEVGAVVLVGGNVSGRTQTLASAVLAEVSAGQYGTGIALGILLLGLILILAAGLTLMQQRGAPGPVWRAS
jgi:tungstate transport system permease protein